MESALYGIYALVGFFIRNLTRSLRSLVRFLIRQQLVRKYRTPALSVKYSLFTVPTCLPFAQVMCGTALDLKTCCWY